MSHTYTAPGTYTAQVTVKDNSGATASATANVTATIDPNAIAAPANLRGSGTRGAATLTWTDKSTNESGFHIERAAGGSSAYTVVGTVGANVSGFSQSVARGTYNYRVQAFNQSTGRVSAYSNVVSVRVR